MIGFKESLKQTQEVVFSKKPQESFHPNLYFNKFVVEKVQTQKPLGLQLDKKLSFTNILKINLPKPIGELVF